MPIAQLKFVRCAYSYYALSWILPTLKHQYFRLTIINVVRQFRFWGNWLWSPSIRLNW